MSWTTPQDIKDRWVGNDIPDDDDLTQALINDAEAVILAEYPKIQQRITANELPVDLVVMVVSRMVSRVLRNPESATYLQQQVGAFGQSRNLGENVDIWLSENEKQLLAPKRRGKAFEVDLGTDSVSAISDDLIWLEVRS